MAWPGRASEFALIGRHFAPLAAAESGALGLTDDAAVLRVPEGRSLVVTTDTMVAGVHFLDTLPATVIGARLVAVSLSDLASMAADPIGHTVSLALPRHLSADERAAWVAGFADGLEFGQQAFGSVLVGGDTVATPGPTTLTMTAMGSVATGQELRRSMARAGDTVYVSGTIGDAALGLLAERQSLASLDAGHRAALVDRYRQPTPRIQTGLRLAGVATAAIDVSDGLVADLGHICTASALSADIDATRVPLSEAARSAVDADPSLITLVLTGGDDYELVFTAAAESAAAVAAIAAETNVALTAIGAIADADVTTANPVRIAGEDGRPMDIADSGYRHF